jgi:hypothetical protein
MQYYCTLFDSFYLNRGLVMYQSLQKHCSKFHLYIFPFDDLSYKILKGLDLENVTLIPLNEFESDDLLSVKPSRSKGEYCWTCTPFTIDYCIAKFNIPHCTYIDADLCFYADPVVLLSEMKNKSILITEHRYTSKYDQSATSGIYCVQYVTFINSPESIKALHWWRDRCKEWCYGRFEDGKFGDQKYLDDWTNRFQDVHVLKHLGGGVAPWNVQQYKLRKKDGVWYLTERLSGDQYQLIFYHFHYVKFFSDGTVNLSDIYNLGEQGVLKLYREYVKRIHEVNEVLRQKFTFIAPTIQKPPHSAMYKITKKIYNHYQKIHGLYNNLSMKNLIKG